MEVTTTRETALAALFAAVDVIGTIPGRAIPVRVRRNDPLPNSLARGALVIVNDGEPGAPEVTLSPLTYHYEHAAEIVVALQVADDAEGALASLCAAIGVVLAADRLIGGCDWIEASAPVHLEVPVDGGAPITAARFTVTLIYSTSDPLA